MEEEIPVDVVRRLIAQMKATTPKNDRPGQAMIRKYERLLREELRRRAGRE